MTVDEAWFRKCVRTMRSRWTGDFFERSLTDDEMRLMTALSSDTKSSKSVIGEPPADPGKTPGRRARVWRQMFRSQWVQSLPPSSLYFNLGHTGLSDPRTLTELRDRGIERIVFLHDLIPITHPEFCRPGDGAKHRERVLNALRYASRILVNSQYTADEITAFAAREGITPPPIDAVHLGLEPTFLVRPTAATPRPYFVHVGTIEARKNLAFLLTIWRRLQERMGDAAPQLVLVGRYGWENEAVLDHLERSPALRGLVHQAADLPKLGACNPDGQRPGPRGTIVRRGLRPAGGRGLRIGVPLIASDIPVHRELVPGATLIDPLDGMGWLDALEKATRHPPKAPPYRPPTWDRHFAEVARCVGLAD